MRFPRKGTAGDPQSVVGLDEIVNRPEQAEGFRKALDTLRLPTYAEIAGVAFSHLGHTDLLADILTTDVDAGYVETTF